MNLRVLWLAATLATGVAGAAAWAAPAPPAAPVPANGPQNPSPAARPPAAGAAARLAQPGIAKARVAKARVAKPRVAKPVVARTALALAATFGPTGATIRSGLEWRIFAAEPTAHGRFRLLATSNLAAPILFMIPGDYIVHVAYGLASAMRRVTVSGPDAISERIPVNAGMLRVTGVLGSATIPPKQLAVDIYVPQPGNFEAKLIVKGAKSGDAIALPEGIYHVVSTYLDTAAGMTSSNEANGGRLTNAVVSADLRVQPGKLTDARLRQHAAILTLKLVRKPGGEALANTTFTVLTPGGDIIRELIGAFPSLVLAEGDYIVIAKRNGKTYEANFSVRSGVDRDIEVMTK